jgi:hypothetical protein
MQCRKKEEIRHTEGMPEEAIGCAMMDRRDRQSHWLLNSRLFSRIVLAVQLASLQSR